MIINWSCYCIHLIDVMAVQMLMKVTARTTIFPLKISYC